MSGAGALRVVSITEEQMAELRKALATGPHGPIVMCEPDVDRLREELARAQRRHALALESIETLAASLERAEETAKLAREAYQVPLPLRYWDESVGPVLWWFFPVQEAPWCGSPGDSDWPGYHTHWTLLPGVMQPDGTPAQPTLVPARRGR